MHISEVDWYETPDLLGCVIRSISFKGQSHYITDINYDYGLPV